VKHRQLKDSEISKAELWQYSNVPSKIFVSSQTFNLLDDEVIVGFNSFTLSERNYHFANHAAHFNFQLMVMRDIQADDLQICECWHKLFVRVKPEDEELKGLQMNLFKDILAYDGVRVETNETGIADAYRF
jgi:hypothetical protein